jgi:hypothetical protein
MHGLGKNATYDDAIPPCSWINIEDKLPEDNSYVLVHLINMPWLDENDREGKRFFKVVKFKKGFSAKELKENNIECYRARDQWENNLKPYSWSEFGPCHYFGQEVDYWMEIPRLEIK